MTCLIITLCYFSIGGIWTLFSHTLFVLLSPQSIPVPRFVESGHWLFLALSSCALYGLLYYWSGVQSESQASLDRMKRSLRRFREYSEAMIKADDEKLIMQEVCRICVEVGEYRMALIASAEQNQNKTLQPVTHWGEAGIFFDSFQATWDSSSEQGKCPAGTSIRTGEPIVFQNLMTNPRYKHCREAARKCGFGSCISLPLKIGNRISGALIIFHTKPDAFDTDEVKLLEELANDLSYGITNIRMQAEYRQGIKEQLMLAAITDQTSDGIITFDPNGIIQYVNPSFIKLCGVPLNEIIGVSIHEFECSRRNPEFYQEISAAIRTNCPRNGHFINKNRNGNEHDIDARIAPVFEKTGKVIRYVVTVRDISQEVQLQRELRQAQKMEVLATLTETVVTDLQKQLTTITDHSKSGMTADSIDDPLRKNLLSIFDAALKSKKLLNQFRAASQRSDRPTELIRISEVVNNSIAALRVDIPSTIGITKYIDPDLGLVAANTGQIHQVIKSLCVNARDAMQKTGGILEISLSSMNILDNTGYQYPDLYPGKYIKLTITDTGHGMDRNELESIFDPFYSTKGQGKGRGLGLSISQRIIRNHGGHISVNSIVGTGTSFTILLPQTNSISDTTAEQNQLEPAGAEQG